jgi:hypothetical protein
LPDAPDQIDLTRHRDLVGRARGLWLRRTFLVLLLCIPVLGLANVFGQHPSTSHASSVGATLTLRVPDHLRSGLVYEARFEIGAISEIKDAHLVLSPQWLEGMTFNQIEPSPSDQTSANGALQLGLGDIRAGHKFVLYMQFQVNPTTVAHRTREVELFDGTTRLISITRPLVVFP